MAHTRVPALQARRRRWIGAALLIAACASAAVRASSPKFFQAATQADFLKGDLDGLAIDSRGQLTIGAASELVYETAAPFLWSMLAAPDGSLFVGTGNEGKVFRIDGDGKGAVFFDAVELEAHALAPAPDGGLFVGTSPDGRIYKVDRRGNSTTFFEPGEKYIWALASDARGQVYAATGNRANVYRVTPDGKGDKFYTAQATNVTALAIDRSGNLLVGTDSPGRVLRVDREGKGFLLLDTPFEEIRSLRVDDKGDLYVAAVNGRTGTPPPPRADDRAPTTTAAEPAAPTPVVSVSTEITAVAVVDTGSSGASTGTPREDRRTPKGAVYRIAADGLWDKLWESREDSPYDVVFDAQGRLVIATGNRGKLYRLEGDPLQPTLIATAGGQQATALYRDGRGRIYYATANPGKLYRLSADRAQRGTYESDTRDASMVSSWGAISWRGVTPAGSKIEISTRSGNSETPNDTWSDWSSPYTVPEGSPIVSPKARYIQWRAVLSGAATPVLTSVTAAYLQRNLRPQVQSVTVHPPGIVFQKPYSTGDPELAGFEDQTTPERKLTNAAMSTPSGASGSPALGRRTYQKGLQTLVWRATDENEDELTFDVLYRREGESAWKTLKEAVTEPILVWDTTTVPNGTYVVRVVASDGPSNPLDSALTGEMDSVAFDIDNTPPIVTVQNTQVASGRTTIAFDVKDDHSPILKVEISEDGARWRAAFPVDGMADSRSERYQVTLDGALGPRGLTIRASDAMNNVVTTQVDAPRR
jgi:sugar lactone lactonase YvrE